MAQIVFNKRLSLWSLLRALFYTPKKIDIDLCDLQEPIQESQVDRVSVDVIIPTLGRKPYLYDVLLDFKNQTKLPEKVIIVEQNPDPKGTSDLEYLYAKSWPFQIVHKFIHQTGACNARNMALDLTTSDYVFLFDDDAKMGDHILEKGIEAMMGYDFNCINFSYLQSNEKEERTCFSQWHCFGSGCSIVSREKVPDLRFDMAFEHGYGEDSDFGMQLRFSGVDVIYAPQLQILHLKAPIGGFRSEIKMPWATDPIQPKPSPQIMNYKLKYTTLEQLYGYKLLLLFKYYPHQSIKNPISYFKTFKKAWNSSLNYASQLRFKK